MVHCLSAAQEISHFYATGSSLSVLKKIPLLYAAEIQQNSINILANQFFTIYFNITHPSTSKN
jgi:hypothetical protein